MDYWKILGIEPTDDKLVIKEAYMDKLNLFHPEEDPEGFQNLRQAYETALKQCDVEEEVDNSPLGLWIQRVKDIYYNFSKRIDTYYWEELLQDEVCFQIDSAKEASERLLGFLMDNYRLPQAIWIILDNQFDWQGKKEELYNKFPYQFIDFIINEIAYKDTVKYDLFEADDDRDFDRWFSLFYSIRDALDERNTEEVKKLLDEIEFLEIKHPEMTVLEIRYLMQIEDLEKAKVLAEDLVNTWPDEANFLYALGQVEFQNDNISRAKECYEKVIEINSEYMGAYIGLGDCLLHDEEFEEAQDYYEKVKRIYPYNNYIRDCITKCIEGKVKNYESILEQTPDDVENLYNLAWGYYDIDEIEKCSQIADKISFSEEKQTQYYDLKGRVASILNKNEEALDMFNKWLLIEPEEKEKIYIYKQISITYYILKQYDKSLEYCDKILEIDENNVDALDRKSDIYNALEKYNEAIYCCDKSIDINASLAHSYLSKAEALYNLGRYKEAMDNCYTVDNIYPYFIKSYLIQIKILYYVSEYEQAMEIVNKVEEWGVDYGEITLYKARILEAMNKVKEAIDVYLSIIDKDTENDLVYYYYACLCNDIGNYDDAIYYVNKSMDLKDDVYKYYLRAYSYRRKKRYSKSLDDYDFIIDNEPDSDRAYNNRALVYVDLEEYEKAENDYKKAIELNPNNRSANNNMGEMYEKRKMYDKALEYYTRQLDIEAGDYYYINRGWCYIKLKRYEEAQKDFNLAIEMEPKNPYAYNGLAHTYKEQKQYQEAIKFFEKAIEFDNEYIYAYRYICDCYEELEQYDEAVQTYNRAIEKFPDDETLYLDRGLLFANQDKYEEALKDYNKAIELYPDYAYAYNNMGIVYRCLKEYDKAIECYKKAIELYPEYAHAYNNIGLVYGDLKNYKKAITSYKKALEIEPNYNRALGNLADLYLVKTKEYLKAIECYSKQLELSDYPASIYKDRAEAYFKFGETEKAESDYNKAIEFYLEELKEDEDDACIHETIAECYQELGNYEEAIKYYEKAIQLAANCSNCSYKQCHEAYYKLGKIEEAKGNYKEALKYYQKAYDIKPTDEEYKEAIDNLTKKPAKQNETGLKKLFSKFKKL